MGVPRAPRHELDRVRSLIQAIAIINHLPASRCRIPGVHVNELFFAIQIHVRSAAGGTDPANEPNLIAFESRGDRSACSVHDSTSTGATVRLGAPCPFTNHLLCRQDSLRVIAADDDFLRAVVADCHDGISVGKLLDRAAVGLEFSPP